MTNTKYKYYKTVKWKDIVFYFKYKDTYKYCSNKHKKYYYYKLVDKVIMRKLVKQFRKNNKLGNSINILSTKEQYWY